MKLILFISLPFIIGGAFHFFGAWLGVPTLIVGGFFWLGTIALIHKNNKK